MLTISKPLAIALLLLKPFPLLAETKAPPLNDCAREAVKAERLYLNEKHQSALHSFNLCFKKDVKNKKNLLFFIKILPENSASQYYEDLLKIADKAIKEKNKGYIPYLALCKYYRNKNRLNNAVSNCRKALTIDPIAYPVYRELGLTYSKTKNSKKAVENFKYGIDISSGNYRARYLLAEEYFKANNNNLALKNYRKAFNLLPRHAKNTVFSAHISKRIKTLKSRLLKKNKAKQRKINAARKAKIEKCVNKAGAYSASDRLEEAYAQISRCLKMDAAHSKARIFSADILMRLGKYESAITEYITIAETKQNKKDLRAFCQIKAGDIYLKMKDNQLAMIHYQKAVKTNKSDINALLKLAKCHETESDFKKAMNCYESILKIEHGNIFAALKVKELKVKTMSNADILKEMKLRLIIDEKTEILTKEVKDLFFLIRKAETEYAVDYLKEKGVILTGRIITDKNQEGKIKLLLNAKGFKDYRWLMTREAISFFEEKEINLKTVFILRNKKGAVIFDKKGNLTNTGLRAYWLALEGKKSWLMPYENPATNPRQEQDNKKIREIRKMGYREISDSELGWLLEATDCPIDVLMPPKKKYLRIIKMEKSNRNFLCYETPSSCSSFGDGAILSTYMEQYRAGNTNIPTRKTSTAFFGKGAVERRNFCHEGKIWDGR